MLPGMITGCPMSRYAFGTSGCPGPKARVSADSGGTTPRWAHGGGELFFWSSQAGSGTLYSATIHLGATVTTDAPRELFKALPGTPHSTHTDRPTRFLIGRYYARRPREPASTERSQIRWLAAGQPHTIQA